MDAAVATLLAQRLGGRWTLRPAGGSGFAATWHARGGAGDLFVKSAPPAQHAMLEAEADGLAALGATGTVRVPAVVDCWTTETACVLAIEGLTFAPPPPDFGARFGAVLAALHRASAPGEGRYGWQRDNWIGGTPQTNRWHDDWPGFFAHERLGALAAQLAQRGAPARLLDGVAALAERLGDFFDDGHAPRPALVHGDLWSGNWAALADGTPVVYDPAVSVSDAEAELAMMELFGGPPAGFWEKYRAAAGLAPGYAHRRGLYQLYHLLNHALLFGGGYLGSAQRLLDTLRHARP
ncbi:fructosamine kinase family protein [Piscinibacter defluvii]|uniref:fructosamine kinase family protein n=1 Tax=Piscinibacter defluvii TaxID=1796922 RepID=UPI000FDDFDBE|nr:fructosamine kinase family protein [Piscinibacter defluvii]